MTAETEWMKYSEIDPEFEQAIAQEKSPFDPAEASIESLRLFAPPATPPPEGVEEEEISIPVRDGTQLAARIHRPSRPRTAGSPLYVIFHGGGFCIGNPHLEDYSSRLFVQNLGFVVLNSSYRLAPEHPFPAAPNDAWDVLQWAAAHAAELGADPSKGFIVGGTSAGGNLAAVCAHLARDEGLNPPLTGVHLMIASACPGSVLPEKYKPKYRSWEQNAEAPGGLNLRAVEKWRRMYNPDPRSSLFAYFNHPKGHAGLPPHFLQVCGLDIFRDEALIYEEVLREESGVRTRLNVYKGVPHGFWLRYTELQASVKFRQDMVDGVGWLYTRRS